MTLEVESHEDLASPILSLAAFLCLSVSLALPSTSFPSVFMSTFFFLHRGMLFWESVFPMQQGTQLPGQKVT